jgi:hypothetical protein
MSTPTSPAPNSGASDTETTDEVTEFESLSDMPDVIDLKEFANNLRTFPDSILKTMLEIKNQQEKRKKQEERSKATLTSHKMAKEGVNS